MRIRVLAVLIALTFSSVAGLVAARSLPASGPTPAPPEPLGPLTLLVGQVSEMKTRNLLPSVANDVPTSDVLFRVYETVLLTDPVTADLLPYIVKGVDYNEDGVFDPSTEYGVFAERPGATTPLEVTLYYDFNGVLWHDGTQVDPFDLLFAYHLNTMAPRFATNLRPLLCDSGATYETCGRQLGVNLWDADGNPANGYQKSWVGEGTMPGDPTLRVGVKHTLNAPSAPFYSSTIAPLMLPMHIWSRTGGGRHADFGCAIWLPPSEASARGIPECGNSDPSRWGKGIAATETVPGSRPYNFPGAEAWNPTDPDVIGSGPFRFETWILGTEARVRRNEQYFYGVDPTNPSIVYDPRLPQRVKLPTIDGITFRPYTDAASCALAVNASDVDFCHANVPPSLVPDLRNTTGVVVEVNPEFTFHYLSSNMRRAPFGYRDNDPADDVGYWFRQAVSHLIDRNFYVDTLRAGLATSAYGVVSPSNPFWYNGSIPKPQYNVPAANAILDAQGWIDTDGDGFRELEGIGDAGFTVYVSTADPARVNASVNLVDNMVGVGLNATLVEMTSAQLAQNLSDRTFDMYVFGWRIGGSPPDPDYLWNFFHSANADLGQNFPGFNSSTFDDVIDASRAEMDRSQRKQEILYAQGIVAEARAYDVFYYLANVEAYREDRWVNWTVLWGTIWNSWSLLGIHPPGPPAPVVQVEFDGVTPGRGVYVNRTTDPVPRALPRSPASVGELGIPAVAAATGAETSTRDVQEDDFGIRRSPSLDVGGRTPRTVVGG